MAELTLGSLFDGSGGFPLGGILAGIKPLWSSEIEPFAIRVTEKHLPDVRHYGDIHSLDGAKLPPVDIITFGSPCQDLSIAGKRNGLGGARSSLFYEAIRVIKEMRCATNGKYPRYLVWENVLGAFSSNKGEDFRAVLENICRVKNADTSIPKPAKWRTAGEIVADGYSAAWRVLDAQYWGVPQRRKRLFLVADLEGRRAGKILFESEGVSGYSAESFRAWQRITSAAENRSGAAGRAAEIVLFENHLQDARVKGPLEIAPTIAANYGDGGNNQPLVIECYDVRLTSAGTKNARHNVYRTSTSRTLDCGMCTPDRNQGGIAVVYSTSKNSYHTRAEVNITGTLAASDYKDPPTVAYGISRDNHFSVAQDKQPSIVARGPGTVSNGYIVRRLMPIECANLQGFPDWWCAELGEDDPSREEIERWRQYFNDYRAALCKKSKPKTDRQIIKWLKNPHSDSAEYKLWGNGVALPCVYFVLAGIAWCSMHINSAEDLCDNDIDKFCGKS